jgi:hypothetical protein
MDGISEDLRAVSNLYILGARQRELLLRDEEEYRLYDSALILEVNTDSGESKICLEYKSLPDVRANDEASIVFKAGALAGKNLYACTSTEVLIFQVPEFNRIAYVSLPCFNDLHHVTRTHDGNLLAANTGLDMVVKFNPEGKVLAEWNVLGEDPWSRFSRSVDYRKVESTKPHQSHPNFVFELGQDVWVTRFEQRDAVCLTEPEKRISIGVQRPHDGVVFGERIYFTTVDGRVVIANCHSLKVERIVDLNLIDHDGAILLGWCRGLLPLDESKIWVGFTRVRKTKFKENVLWIKHGFRETGKPTHIALYDLAAKRCLQEIDLDQYGLNVLFGIYPAEELHAASSQRGFKE